MLEIWKYGKYSKTASMFIYFLDLKLNHISSYGFKLKNAYIDDHGKEKEYDENCIFLQLESTLSKEDVEGAIGVFKRIEGLYVDSYKYEEDLIVVIRVPRPLQEKFRQFKRGKYSQLGMKEAGKYFSLSDVRYHVILKGGALRSTLEKELGVTIPEDAELADPLDPSKEILRFDINKFTAIEKILILNQ